MSWIEELDLSGQLSPNELESFKTTMGDYKTLPDAIVGGYNAKKAVGKPFKLPEDIEKLPENIRNEFTSKTKELLKIEPAVTEDTIKQVNFTKGLADGQKQNETIVNKIKEIAVKKGFSQSQTQDLVEMMNVTGNELRAAMEKETEDNFKKAIESSHKILSDYFGEEKLKTESENLRKAFKNNLGLSNEEYESVAEELMDNGWIFRHPAVAKVMIDNFAKLAKEGETPQSTPSAAEGQQTKYQQLKNEGYSDDTIRAMGIAIEK